MLFWHVRFRHGSGLLTQRHRGVGVCSTQHLAAWQEGHELRKHMLLRLFSLVGTLRGAHLALASGSTGLG